ncbi:MAG TPA: ABC transporter permease [Nocardioidaceae bacterium]|nr:ABC transporter permease [Nocardioidaceae bacterium]
MALVGLAVSRSGAPSGGPPGPPRTSGWPMVRRNFRVYRSAWLIFLTGFLEPVFYLFSIGVGVGQMIDSFEFNGHAVAYASFVAPGMLAASAMNGAVLDSTFGIFFKLKYDKIYDGVLATPMRTVDIAVGELIWSLLRSGVYSGGFLLVMAGMGLVDSWWAVLAWPATWLIGFAFAGVGMALTTFMKSWQDFEYVQLAIIPMFLFSATFFPVSTYDGWLRWVVEVTPLYRGVALCRELSTGVLSVDSAISVVYLLAMGAVGLLVASRRFDKLLLH